MKKLICLAIVFLPQCLKRFVMNKILGHDIHPTARIGLSYIDVKKIIMGPHARIGRFNVFRNLERVEFGQYTTMGNRNYVSGLPLGSTVHFRDERDRFPALILGQHTAIGSNHIFDCNNTIRVGDFSALAGRGSQFYTHGISMALCKQESDTITIGDYCRVATMCVVIKGSALPNGSTLAANSTLHKSYTDEYHLYSGVPAKPVKALDKNWPFFHRTKGFVD